MVRVACNEALACGYEGCQAALHVRGATAEKVAIPDHGIKGWVRPVLFRPGWYHIGMAGKGQHRPLRALSGPEVIGIAKAQVLAGEAQRRKARHHQFLTAGIVWRDRRPADQFNGKF